MKLWSWVVLSLFVAIGVLAGLIAGVGFLSPSDPIDFAIVLMAIGAIVVGGAVVGNAAVGRCGSLFIYLSAMIFFIEFSLRAPRVYEAPGQDGQAVLRMALWAAAMGIGLLALLRGMRLNLPMAARWMLFFNLWAVWSAVYSYSPLYTFAAGLALCSFFVLSVALVTQLNEDAIYKAIAIGSGFLVFLSLLFLAVMPAVVQVVLPIEGVRFRGLSGSPNGMGRIASVFLIAVSVLHKRQRLSILKFLGCALLGVAALFLAQSRVAAVATCAAVLVIYVPWRRLGVVAIVGIAVALTAGIWFANFGDVNEALVGITRSGDLKELYTVSNRASIWNYALARVAESPLLGYGYASTRTMMPDQYWTGHGYTVTSAHNMFLQTALTTGLVGLMAVFGILLNQVKLFILAPHPFRDSIFVFVVLTGLTEAGAVGVTPNMLTFLWILSLCVPAVASVRGARGNGEQNILGVN